jgi:phosphatidylethanolamine/phosphatidyl-N-methylethanolamine N-methyltransferase
MHNTLASYCRFFLAAIANQGQIGAVLPSQRFLVARMIEPIPPDYPGQILELGAGTGVLTERLAARCPQARILTCEINAVLAKTTRNRLTALGFSQRAEVVCEAAEQLLIQVARARTRKPDFVLSGIPLGNLDRNSVVNLLESIHASLAPGGLYIQFQHSLIDRKKIRDRFSRLRTIPVLMNFPPAFVYFARK